MISKEDVTKILSQFADPETGRNVVETQQVADITVDGSTVSVTLGLTSHSSPLAEETRQSLQERLQAELPPGSQVNVRLTTFDRPPMKLGQIGLAAKSVIAVGSGKGGVGKSTIAVSLAYGLKRAGCTVGVMDADVYGPSVPHLMGVEGRPAVADQRIQPIVIDDIPVMSMGFLVPPDEAVVWRGPMLHGAITQFLRDTDWGELDYLIIDMPPGTGDIALTLSQLLPLTGCVVVCTPQDVALLDAVKAIAMFRKVNIPVLGMVENMSGFVCPDCHKRYDIFGSGGAQRAEDLEVPFLGEVPINIKIRVSGDAGEMRSVYDDPANAAVLEKLSYQLVKNMATANAARPPMPTLPVL